LFKIKGYPKRSKKVLFYRAVSLKLVKGREITGEVDISGYNRVSDYFQTFSRRFYQVFQPSTPEKRQTLLLISSGQVL
jgi:hypothetical protein